MFYKIKKRSPARKRWTAILASLTGVAAIAPAIAVPLSLKRFVSPMNVSPSTAITTQRSTLQRQIPVDYQALDWNLKIQRLYINETLPMYRPEVGYLDFVQTGQIIQSLGWANLAQTNERVFRVTAVSGIDGFIHVGCGASNIVEDSQSSLTESDLITDFANEAKISNWSGYNRADFSKGVGLDGGQLHHGGWYNISKDNLKILGSIQSSYALDRDYPTILRMMPEWRNYPEVTGMAIKAHRDATVSSSQYFSELGRLILDIDGNVQRPSNPYTLIKSHPNPTFDSGSGVAGHAGGDPYNYDRIMGGDITISTRNSQGYFNSIIIHEIGHMYGLGHNERLIKNKLHNLTVMGGSYETVALFRAIDIYNIRWAAVNNLKLRKKSPVIAANPYRKMCANEMYQIELRDTLPIGVQLDEVTQDLLLSELVEITKDSGQAVSTAERTALINNLVITDAITMERQENALAIAIRKKNPIVKSSSFYTYQLNDFDYWS